MASACAFGAALLLGPLARAHPITVDGSATEWSTRVPAADNLGLVARNAAGEGEYVWLDNAADTRTDLATPENDANITRVQYTGTAAGLGIFVRLASTAPTGAPVQLQVAIDTDQTAASGQNYLAGFADTQVADAARWEYLVQTRFGSGGTAAVLDTTFAARATVAAVRGADGIEVFVPWSALGLAAPPTRPLRFTVATFRAQASDDTVAIGDGTVSNALDAVTDYGDPRASAYPNTFAEVSDGVINYFADVHFTPAGEVYAPLMVTRFVADAAATTVGGNEWVAVSNMTPNPIALGAFRIGDEETVDSTEGMYSFPAAATLAPGATFIVAASGSQYAARYGRAADAEFATTAGDTTPDMTRYTLWTPSGSWGLANGGDEIVVLDPSNTLVDVVNYGTSTYLGLTPAAVISTTARVYSRNAALADRDDNAMDFSDAGATCGPDTDCGGGTCARCDLNACAPRAAGVACSDGNACNGAETCNGAGVCAAGTALVCNDGNPCTVDACDAVMGCVAPPAAAGTACSDGDLCNGAETCNAAGACTAGTALVCADSNPCTTNSCNPATGCVVGFVSDGVSCGSTNVCSGRQVCGSGVCVTEAPLTCADGNVCTVDACNPASGCDFPAVTPGTSCSDGNACNGAEACNATGVCASGAAPSCDDSNPCTADACDPTGGCSHTPVTAGIACSDGNACNGAETCNATGACTAGTALLCNDSNACTNDACNPATGCTNTPVGAGATCDDGNACNGADTCNAAGACVGGVGPSCDDGNPCTADGCSATTGCTHTPVSAGTACSDGNACNGAETCNAMGTCAAGTALSCNDSNPCTVDTCNPATGCASTPALAGTACSDGNACNGAETCNAMGTCAAGTPVVCTPTTAACRVNTCDPATGLCVPVNAMAGASCDDGDLCNGLERCDTSGSCVMGAPSDAGLCSDAGDASSDADDASDVSDVSVDVDDAATDTATDTATDAADASTDADDASTDADDASADADDASTDADDASTDADDASTDADATDARADVQDAAADVTADVATDGPDAALAPTVEGGGCGCRTTNTSGHGALSLVAMLAALAAVRARRRRR